MAQNIQQIFATNPAASMLTTDLLYLGRSPYGSTDDFAVTFANLEASITQLGQNVKSNNFVPGFTNTTTSAGTTILTAASTYYQYFTGSSNQTVLMPVTSTLYVGLSYRISNISTGAITLQSSGGNAMGTIGSGQSALVTCISTVGTTASSWNTSFSSDGGGVSSITVTPDELIASSSTGDITLGIAPTYVGQSSITTLGTISTGIWQSNLIQPAYGGTGVNNGSSTLTLAGNLATIGLFAAIFAFTGSTSVTFPVSGTLATTSQLPTPSAMTSSNDTNVTITLGGTPATSLLQSVSLTMGWNGQLSLARGGLNANLTASNGGIFYSTASAGAILSGTATAGQMLQSGSSSAPSWSTSTYPATNAINTLLYASSANTMSALAAGSNGVLISNNTSVPSWLANSGTPGYVLTANAGAPPSWQSITAEGAITTLVADSGSAVPSAGSLLITGGVTGLTTSGSVNTLSITGTLNLTSGGTNASLTASNGGIVYSTASALAVLAGTGTSQRLLLSTASGAPQWSTSTYPLTNSANTLLYASSSNTMAALTAANNGVLITSNTNVPSWLANGTVNQVLTANTGAPPSWKNVSVSGAVTTINGNSGSATPSSGTLTITSTSAGLTFTGSGSTLTLSGTPTYAAPQFTANLSGSGTYVTPAGALYLRVLLMGGGAGGSASGTSPGTATAGNNSTFGALTANGGAINGGTPGGGTIGIGSGAIYTGGRGQPGSLSASATGGEGGDSFFGGAGAGGLGSPAAATAAAANSGSGGGGGGGAVAVAAAAGGSAGGCLEVIITSPAATYSFAVGAAANGATLGTGGAAGGNGGSGALYVTAYFQ